MVKITLKENETQTLDQLKVGERAKLVSINAHHALKKRLLEMGLTTGSSIEVIGKAPMGDPIEYKIRNYRLSLRKEEAKQVIVK